MQKRQALCDQHVWLWSLSWAPLVKKYFQIYKEKNEEEKGGRSV